MLHHAGTTRQVLGWIDRPVELLKIDAQGLDLSIVRSARARVQQLRRVSMETVGARAGRVAPPPTLTHETATHARPSGGMAAPSTSSSRRRRAWRASGAPCP